MNFCFVIDTSTSMLQYFDKGYSYFDAAKSAIEHFIKSKILNLYSLFIIYIR